MKQYCRYCSNAFWRDEGVFYCDEKKKFYNESTAKVVNKCKHFDFNSNDLFGMDENCNFKQYKPRDKYKTKEKVEDNRISLFESEVDTE